ncbi:hypothetical protein JW766_00065 [Candidatus Dojkabacteria bacterium]|nr:hypothetical protein [Candidatus Dojkabacteria bacterium]
MKNKYISITIISILMITGAGLASYFIFSNQNKTETYTASTSTVSTTTQDNDTQNNITDSEGNDAQTASEQTIVMYHNGTGPMCIEALDFFEEQGIEFKEHLNTEEGFKDLLSSEKERFNGVSEGVSDSFGYYPIIIIETRAFSGFDDNVKSEILSILNAAPAES